MDCCGVKELSGLASYPNPQEAMRALGAQLYPDPEKNKVLVNKVRERAKKDGVGPCRWGYLGVQVQPVEGYAVWEDPAQYSRFRFAIFTEAHGPAWAEENGPKYGQNFAAFIRETQLGDVIETGRHVNPNSSNKLKVWVWTVDHAALVGWLKDDAKKRHKAQPTVSLFAGGNERWANPGTLSGEPGVNNRWEGNQESNASVTVPTAGGAGGSLPGNCESTVTCAPAQWRQG